MIRVFIVLMACFAATWWLPMSQPVGLEFQDYVVKVQLWLVVFACLAVLFVIYFIRKILNFFVKFPSQFQSMNLARHRKSLVRYRERMVWEWMMARYDALEKFYKNLGAGADWSDHVLVAVAALKEKSLLKFDESLLAMKTYGFSERLIQILRLYLLSLFSEQDVEQDMLSLLEDRDGAKIVWQWAAYQDHLNSPEWFNARLQAKSHLSDEVYSILVPRLVRVALQHQNFESVYQALSRKELGDSRIIDQLLDFSAGLKLSTSILTKALKRSGDDVLFERAAQCVKDKEFCQWFLSYTAKRKEVGCLCVRAYIALCLDDVSIAKQVFDQLCQSINFSDSMTPEVLRHCDNRVLLLINWWHAKQLNQRLTVASTLCHTEFASKHFTDV